MRMECTGAKSYFYMGCRRGEGDWRGFAGSGKIGKAMTVTIIVSGKKVWRTGRQEKRYRNWYAVSGSIKVQREAHDAAGRSASGGGERLTKAGGGRS